MKPLPKRFYSLDGLRGLAIIGVILFHGQYLQCGWLGVQVFFVLSGFLITSILRKSKDMGLYEYCKSFYTRRALRIFPLYFSYISFIGIIFLITHQPKCFEIQWPYLFTYAFNLQYLSKLPTQGSHYFSHLWSLAVEEQFYLFWPFVVFFLNRKWLTRVLVSIIILAPISRYVAVTYFQANQRDQLWILNYIYYLTPFQLDSLAIGGLVAVLPTQDVKNPKYLFIASLTLIFIGSFFGYAQPLLLENLRYLWTYPIWNAAAATLILTLIRDRDAFKFLSTPWLTYIGKISYGIYIFHFPLQGIFNTVLHIKYPQTLGVPAFATYLIILFSLASISYWYFERRFLNDKSRTRKLRQSPLFVVRAFGSS